MPKIRISSSSAEHIARKLRILRQDRGLTQSQVAQSCSMSAVAYSKMELGCTNYNIARLEQLADLYDVHGADLIDSNIEKPRKLREYISPYDYEKVIREKEVMIQILTEKIYQMEDGHPHHPTGR